MEYQRGNEEAGRAADGSAEGPDACSDSDAVRLAAAMALG